MRHLLWPFIALCLVLNLPFLFQAPASAQDLQLPVDYGIDLQLAEAGRFRSMHGAGEIAGTVSNQIGDDVFHRLVSAGFSQPYPWRLTLVNNDSVNASSTAGGQIYVYGGILPLLGQNRGWASGRLCCPMRSLTLVGMVSRA